LPSERPQFWKFGNVERVLEKDQPDMRISCKDLGDSRGCHGEISLMCPRTSGISDPNKLVIWPIVAGGSRLPRLDQCARVKTIRNHRYRFKDLPQLMRERVSWRSAMIRSRNDGSDTREQLVHPLFVESL
jgi:hypothetical protein